MPRKSGIGQRTDQTIAAMVPTVMVCAVMMVVSNRFSEDDVSGKGQMDHVVMFKLDYVKDSDDEKTFLARTRELLSKIEGVVSVSAGRNYPYLKTKDGKTELVTPWGSRPGGATEPLSGDRARGFTHCVVVRFESKDVLDIYQEHPLHLEVRDQLIKPHLLKKVEGDKLLAFDLESERLKGPASAKEAWKLAAASGWLAAACALGYIFTRGK